MAQGVQWPGARLESSLPQLGLTLTLKAALIGGGWGALQVGGRLRDMLVFSKEKAPQDSGLLGSPEAKELQPSY